MGISLLHFDHRTSEMGFQKLDLDSNAHNHMFGVSQCTLKILTWVILLCILVAKAVK